MKKSLEERNKRICNAYESLRKKGLSSAEAIESIEQDKSVNGDGLTYDYIRRFIIFGKKASDKNIIEPKGSKG